jgi:hypothetical protein
MLAIVQIEYLIQKAEHSIYVRLFGRSSMLVLSLYTASLSIYKNNNAIAIAGNSKPTVGTRIEGRKEAAMIKYSFAYMNLTLDLKLADR